MKIKVIVLVMLTLIMLTGATVWEGAAAVAPSGDLPDTGYYAATNSFPRNTVVDITNLENGKSIRVIVASGLETPGLLAVLSRNAAETIGLASRSVGRIRINQPSDPVAFSRFTEGLGSSGDPDFDPGGMIIDESVYSSSLLPQSPANRPAFNFFPESEWADDTYREIVDLSESYTPPHIERDEGIGRESAPAPDCTENVSLPDYLFVDPIIADVPPDKPFVIECFDESEYISKIEEALITPVYPESPDFSAGIQEERYDYALLPAEERPPYDPYHTPRALIDESLFIDPVGGIAAAPQDAVVPEGPFVTSVNLSECIPPSAVLPEIPAVLPESADTFSVPVINGLAQGKYYVQLGTFNKAELVEDEIARIGGAYPLAIQKGEESEKPIYRILLGPLNLGEGGAVLQRFKSIGYKDAFLRRN